MSWARGCGLFVCAALFGCESTAPVADAARDGVVDEGAGSDAGGDVAKDRDGAVDIADAPPGDAGDAHLTDGPDDAKHADGGDVADDVERVDVLLDAMPDVTDERTPDAGDDVVGVWSCPPEWVPYEAGGCGPAVLLCVPDGGAAVGACAGIDLTRPHAVTDADGGVGTSFYRLPDGGIGGGWSERPWTCPTGWSSLPDGTCDPRLPVDCPAGSSPLPGGACTTTAMRDCPSEAYADVAAEAGAARVVRVRAGAVAGGDGSVERPFATIAEGIRAAAEGGWVLVAAGTYTEALAVTASVHVIGRCAAMVTVAAPGAMAMAAALEVAGPGTRVEGRGVTLAGTGAGVHVRRGGELLLRATAVIDTGEGGIIAEDTGSRLTLDDVRVVGRAVGAEGGGKGLRVDNGAAVTVRRTAVEDSREYGVAVGAMSGAVEVSDSLVRRTQFIAGRASAGVFQGAGTNVRVARVVVEDSHQWGILVAGAAAITRIDDAVIRRTGLGTYPAQQGGLGARDGAQVTAARVRLSDNLEAGVNTREGGALCDLTDAWIEGTREVERGSSANALSANVRSTLRARRVVLRDNEVFGLAVDTAVWEFPATGLLEVSDSLVTEMRLGRDGIWGVGVGVHLGGRLRATRLAVVGAREIGVGVAALGEADFEDMIVLGTAPTVRGFGVGVGASTGGQLRFTRLAVERVHGTGVAADQHTEDLGFPLPSAGITGADLFLRGVGASSVAYDPRMPTAPGSIPVAYGVMSGRDTRVNLQRAVVARGGYGLAIFGPLTMRDAVIADQDVQGFRNTSALMERPDLERVRFVRNTREMLVDDNTLPEGRLPISRD